MLAARIHSVAVCGSAASLTAVMQRTIEPRGDLFSFLARTDSWNCLCIDNNGGMIVLCGPFLPPPCNLGVCLLLWGSDVDKEHQSPKRKEGVWVRRYEGREQLRLMEGRRFRWGAGLHGNQDDKTTGLS